MSFISADHNLSTSGRPEPKAGISACRGTYGNGIKRHASFLAGGRRVRLSFFSLKSRSRLDLPQGCWPATGAYGVARIFN
jgi:hypothetical protein